MVYIISKSIFARNAFESFRFLYVLFDVFSADFGFVCVDPLNILRGVFDVGGLFGEVRSTVTDGDFKGSLFLDDLLLWGKESSLWQLPLKSSALVYVGDRDLLVVSDSSLIFDRFFVIRLSIDCCCKRLSVLRTGDLWFRLSI